MQGEKEHRWWLVFASFARKRRVGETRRVSTGCGKCMSLVSVLGSIGMAFGSAPQSQPRPSELYPAYFDSLPSMAGKTVVVTGASRGLGYVTALSVARKGATVFLVGRSSARADAALDAIRSASTGPAPQLVECDLLNFGSVRKAAAALRECAGD